MRTDAKVIAAKSSVILGKCCKWLFFCNSFFGGRSMCVIWLQKSHPDTQLHPDSTFRSVGL